MYRLMGFFIRSGYGELRGPGVFGFLVARDRYIDEVLEAFLRENLRQLVILGAGLDSRPYRFSVKHIPTFEVDHPATQAEKIRRVRRAVAPFPDHVRFVSVDFNRQNLADRLAAAGYDTGLKTLFVWQGVTMYLEPAAVLATLDFIRAGSAPGSAVVFDYIFDSLLDGSRRQNEISSMRRYRFMTGEGLRFGIAEGQAEAFLQARGFRRAKNVLVRDLKQKYFHGQNAARPVADGYGIVTGWVG
ncbi:MAG: class I SAM-dependent methyltransferase, partial [Anaerolineaceae bacterium]